MRFNLFSFKARALFLGLSIALGLFASIIFVGYPSRVFALGAGISVSTDLADKNAQEGDIISSTQKGYVRSVTEYDASIVGVLVKDPMIALENTLDKNPIYILSEGQASVRVSTKNGPIVKNDLITSSKIAGVGQKATSNGFVIGNALDNYTGSNIGKIEVRLKPHYANSFSNVRSNLVTTLKNAGTSAFITPLESFRYVVAILIVLLVVIFGLVYFGLISLRGIESIGRNPLARRFIEFSVMLKIMFMGIITLLGLLIAYLILVL